MESGSNIFEILLGSAIAIAAQAFYAVIGIIRDWAAGRRERQNKLIEVDAMERKFLLEEELKNKAELKLAYQNAIRNLSLISAQSRGRLALTESDLASAVDEATNWLTVLSFHFRELQPSRSRNFLRNFEEFRSSPSEYAKYLLEEIDKLANTDPVISSSIEIEQDESILRSIQVDLDEDFLREQFIEGIELNKTYILKFRIEELTEHQRMKLWDLYPNQYPRPPYRIYLRVPKYDQNRKEINLLGEPWKARVNPEKIDIVELFSAWEQDYDKHLMYSEASEETNSESHKS